MVVQTFSTCAHDAEVGEFQVQDKSDPVSETYLKGKLFLAAPLASLTTLLSPYLLLTSGILSGFQVHAPKD